MRRVAVILTAGVATALLAGWFLVVWVPGWFGPRARPAAPPPAPARAEVRKIRARLFYVAQDGRHLVGVERDVPYGATPVEQAHALIEEQLREAPPPLLAPLPAGTSVRAVFLTGTGDAYVDLSKEAAAAHTGGSLDELFSVYAIVNAITVNLPAIGRVQVLVEGKEVDSLAGHIDLRQPLPRSDRWVQAAASPPAGTGDPAAPPSPAPAPTPSQSPTPSTSPSPTR